MVNLPPVDRLIPIRDESNEGGVIRKLQELDGLMTGGAAVSVQGEEQRGKNAALTYISFLGHFTLNFLMFQCEKREMTPWKSYLYVPLI